MARTNKQGIARQKAQQERQRKLLGDNSGSTQTGEKLVNSFENPLGHRHQWFLRCSKRVCDDTSGREDPDGYRIRRRASGGEIEWFQNLNGFDFKRYRKKSRNLK